MKAWSTGDSDSGGDEWGQEIRLTEQAVEAINKLKPKPKFFVLCGDLIHAMPGKTRAVDVTFLPSSHDCIWAGENKRISLKRCLGSVMAHSFSPWLLEYPWTSENAPSFLHLDFGEINHSN